jgi:hypothetical protein
VEGRRLNFFKRSTAPHISPSRPGCEQRLSLSHSKVPNSLLSATSQMTAASQNASNEHWPDQA